MIRWLALLLLATLPARAAELAMFDRADCPVCIRWNKEVGPTYPKTPESRRAPLHRVAIGADPGFAVDLFVESSLKTLTGVWMVWAPLRPALDRGDIYVCGDAALNRWREPEQPQGVADLRTRATDPVGQLLVRAAKVVQQLLVRSRLFQRVQL